MPLLKRKAFEKSTASEYLRDDDEVFHCEVTDEIFKDYEEYCQRIILVNSMVWTCEMTGKNNLTYAEALESEKNARKSLKDFPMELRIPILYLASKTKRSSFAEMSEDVFNFVRERFFVGETVEACLEGDVWQEAHILSVTVQKQQPGSKAMIPATSYIYEVEQYDESEADSEGQVCSAPHDRVRRRKGVYTRDKNRLFLKQHVELNNGIVVIKKAALDKYSIHKTSFDQIFTGSPPEFSPSKKLMVKVNASPAASKGQAKPGSAKGKKKPSPDKKGQTSMDKFVKKQDKTEVQKKPADPAAKKSAQELAEKMRRAEDQMRQRKEEEKAKKKEKNARLQAYIKEWQKVKDDLELEDHKVIPKGTPIDVEGVPHKHFGDFLSVLEFVYVYADILKTKDVFHNELDVESFRKALTMKEHAGVFSDLVQMFLTTIFSLQEDEAEDYNEKGGIQESTGDIELDSDTVGVPKAVELATKASKWSQTYLGTPLSKLPLDPTTVSEVLRLHLLSSGSAGGSRCATWRYQQRGGYSSHDDAGLRLRVTRPALIARLATTHVASLQLDDKFQLLQCLMNQILSYATVRDVIEEKLEELKNTKYQLRTLQINERKREAQVTVARQELKKQFAAKKEELKLTGDKAKALEEEHKAALEKLAKESEEKKAEFERKAKELQVQVFDYASYVGTDRAFRRYWLNQRVAGLFVEAGDENRGACRDKPLPPAPIHNGDTIAYVTELFHRGERAGSDKENDSGANSRGNSPKKPFSSVNGLAQKLNGLENDNIQKELMICSGDTTTCFVHGKADRPQWEVFHTEEQIEALIQSLNKRGLRESELRQALELDKYNILEYVKKCPVHMLNPKLVPPPPQHHSTRNRKFQPSLLVQPEYTISEALELSLRDHILELEEKVFHGCLGALQVKDREAWRGTIMVRGYDKQVEYLTWGPNRQYRDDYHLPNGVLNVPEDKKSELETIPQNKYRDPGHYLEAPKVNGVKSEGPGERPSVDDPAVVRGLASALLQVSQGIHHKYIKRPLGLDEKERKEREAKNKALDLEALERWEVSLMECRSLAAIVLHLFTLDSSVCWSASILNASCRLCRRKTDPDNMLLCDNCNKGHHLYCLKPKLSKVPEGDWFCDQCKPKERTPRKRRKLFSDEDIEDALNSDEESFSLDNEVCGTCGSGGRLAACCVSCRARFHPECCAPPLARAARRWTCRACLHPARETRRCAATALSNIHQYTMALETTVDDDFESDESDDNTALVNLKVTKSRSSKESSPMTNGGAKRGRKATDDRNTSRKNTTPPPLKDAVRLLFYSPKKDDSRKIKSEISNGRKSKSESTNSRKSKSLSPPRTGVRLAFPSPKDKIKSSRKSRDSLTNGVHLLFYRPKDEKNTSSRKSKHSLTNGVHEEKSAKKRSSRQVDPDVKLHTEALDILLRDVMRHKDCWPFYEPVNVEEVPDYLDVISTPMDFSTMRQKLESGQYSADEELIADAALVLGNCYTYNKDTHPVARAGVRLERYINKRCSELDLPSMPEIALDGESASGDTDSLKRRAISPIYEDQDAPRSKKPKLK